MHLRFGVLVLALGVLGGVARAAPCPSAGGDVVLTDTTCQLSGIHTYNSLTLVNSTIEVVPFDGTDKIGTGNLELRANTISIDATSKITARGSGYKTDLCGNGKGPTAIAGGRGGCSLRDSGGGGAHFGGGGRGTIDSPGSFPAGYEEDCSRPVADGGLGIIVTYSGTLAKCELPSAPGVRAPGSTSCRAGNDGLPTVAGQGYYHSIYEPEFGGSGGDKGCLDGDGWDPAAGGTSTGLMVAGSGGGRIVLAAVNAAKTGQITIAGTIDANGKRGCGIGNDSGGGGAGGTVLIAGDNVTIDATATVSAAGGLGGDTQGLSTDPTGECVAPYQQNRNADDCGGGGGGGIVSVLSGTSALIDDRAVFNVNGAAGGVSTICRGEAGGGVGELQISGAYVGEVCDGYDNDFDGTVDDGLPTINCGTMTIQSCMNGEPQQCPAVVPTCQGPVTDSRTRFTVILDTSGSMLGDLAGYPTFGDGSFDHPGLDHNNNSRADDSRLFKAKAALTNVISAYPNIDFALARYHQDQSLDRSCQNAHNFECNAICCSYDNPNNNTGAAPTPACTVVGVNPPTRDQPVLVDTPGDECINYAGSCGPPRRGADVLVGFGADINNYLMWLDGTEMAFDDTDTPGAYCNFAGGKDCELRGTGPTPLANSLQAVEDYLTPIKACDLASTGGCRKYGVILLTDGAESCQGDPVAAAAALRMKGINTYVIGFSTLAGERAQLDDIAAAGGTGTAFVATDEDSLANTLATIVSSSIVFETCNSLDDDCDGRIDEDFPQKGAACDNGLLGACRSTGTLGCSMNGAGLTCNISMTGPGSSPEVCNGIDDNCNGAIDDGISCTPGCVKSSDTDLCNGLDDDCDGAFEEDDPEVGQPCGTSNISPCMFGTNACIGGDIVCVGELDPNPEVCNGLDDNCDGMPDVDAPCPSPTSCVEGGCRLRCAGGEFPCLAGFRCETTPAGDFCVPSACATCAPNEICQDETCIDPCAGITCAPLEECRFGTCVNCDVLGCPAEQVCSNSMCIPDPCKDVDCAANCASEYGCSCNDGTCVPNCDDTRCLPGQRCDVQGNCIEDVCAGVECDEFEVCVDGQCMQDPCVGIACRAGQVCIDRTCVEDPCKLLTCSDAFHCEVRDGAGYCAPDTPAGRVELVQAGGGGGCSTSGDGGGLAGLAFAVLALVKRRRS
ncbi:MAG: MopE-related protein [Kofleriaceae bacterium]|nr:MopE-related protein [Kofleriaceae bacterium]